jgi:hypothetical protein
VADKKAPYYIHVADTTFGVADPGSGEQVAWPGVRRLGPYLSVDEAVAQAAHDLATGYLSRENLVGIYDDATSSAYEDKPPTARAGAAAVVPSKVHARAETLRRHYYAQQVAAAEDQRGIVERLLPEGVGYDDLMALADQQRAVAARLAAETQL